MYSMATTFKRRMHVLRWYAKEFVTPVIGWLTVLLLRLVRCFDRKRTANLTAGYCAGSDHGCPNTRPAAPISPPPFRRCRRPRSNDILAGVWDNLGRVASEFAHLDRITFATADDPEAMDIVYNPVAAARLNEIRDSSQPRVLFAAHLANWELPAV